MLCKSLLTLALSAVALCSFGDSATAQVVQLPGTGCRGAAFPHTNGRTGIGQRFIVRCPPCPRGQLGFVVLGLTGPNVVLGPPITCLPRQRCILACNPFAILGPGVDGWAVQVPNTPHVIGRCLCIQCGCLDRRSPCITLSGAIRMCITRL